MPNMDGHQCTRAIRSGDFPEVAIIAVTANTMDDDRGKCLESGMDDYLSKPVKLEELARMLKRFAPGRLRWEEPSDTLR